MPEPSSLITKSAALKLVRKWECLGFSFPRTDNGVESLAEAFMKIVGTVEHANWLSDRIINGFERCPTPIEMRRYFSARRAAPADGVHERDYDASDITSGGWKGKQ